MIRLFWLVHFICATIVLFASDEPIVELISVVWLTFAVVQIIKKEA